MNIPAYIESGILEMYALDLLDLNDKEEVERMVSIFPAIKAELDSIQHALKLYAESQSIKPSAGVKKKVTDTIENLQKEEDMDPDNLPLISSFSDHNKWLKLVDDIPFEIEDGRFMKVLQKTPTVMQVLMVSETDFEDETHDDLHESFLILEGRCKCTVGTDIKYMEAGDFMAIPLHTPHTVELLSETVVAILQRVAISA